MEKQDRPAVPKAGIQSVDRAFAALSALADTGGEAGVSELSDLLALPNATVHRILSTLVQLGYVIRLPSRRYALGPQLIRLGDSASRLLAMWVMPALEHLSEKVQETVNMAMLDGNRAVYVAQVPSRRQMRMFTEVGHRVFLHSTGVGKAILSQFSNEKVRTIMRASGMPPFTEATYRTEDELIADLDEVRVRGYAIDDGEQEVGVRCFSVPVRHSFAPAAVSVSGPDARVTLASGRVIVPALLEATELVRDRLRT